MVIGDFVSSLGLGNLPIWFRQGVAANDIGGTILSNPFFLNAVLPFILIFTVVFAILQKSEILGKGRRQIDAIVSLIIGLIVISFANAVGIITSLIPFLAVSIVIILVFLILYSMVFQGDDKFQLNKGIKIVLGILITIGVVVAVLISTGAWDYLRYEVLFGGAGGTIITNVIFLIILAIAVAVVVWPTKKDDK